MPWQLPEAYAFLRQQAPVAATTFSSGETVWLVSTYDLVRQVLASPNVSSEHSHPAFPGIFPVRKKRNEKGEPPKLPYSGMDGREHAFHRKKVSAEFSRAAAEKFRPAIEQAAALQADQLEERGSPAELVAGFARPLVGKVIGSYLGLSRVDVEECARLAGVLLGNGDDGDAAGEALRRLRVVVSKLLKQKVVTPGNDLLGRLVTGYLKDGTYEHDQLVSHSVSLITAGLETTANMISLSVMTLLEHPGQMSALIRDRSLMPNAVTELLRYLSIADIVTARVAVADIHLGGCTIPEGAGIIALTASANRDANAFHDPDILDIRRRADYHLGFGHGSHKCLGQHIAKIIVECAVGALIDRFQSIRLSPVDEKNGKISKGVMCGVDRLLFAWDVV